MKNITNAYLVLSVANIRAMLHAAELEQKVRGEPTRESVTIVLNYIAINLDDDCQPQISASSLMRAVDSLVAESNEDLDSREAAPTPRSPRRNARTFGKTPKTTRTA